MRCLTFAKAVMTQHISQGPAEPALRVLLTHTCINKHTYTHTHTHTNTHTHQPTHTQTSRDKDLQLACICSLLGGILQSWSCVPLQRACQACCVFRDGLILST